MNIQSQAIQHIEQAQLAEFFHLAAQYNSNQTGFANLQKEFINGQNDKDFYDRLSVFAKAHLPNIPLQGYYLSAFHRTQNFIGREQELKDLHKFLQEKPPTVILNGLGGLGKTLLAKKYVEEYESHYQHILWLEQQTTLLNAFINEEYFMTKPELQQGDEDTRFKAIIAHLQAKQGKNLLIIDNFEHNPNEPTNELLTYLQDRRLEHWAVLLTSREQVPQFKKLALDTLPKEQALELFKKHCPHKAIDPKAVQDLLKHIAYHTLTIELLAKTYAESMEFEDLPTFINTLEEEGLDAEDLQEDVHLNRANTEIQLYAYLKSIFKLQKLDPDAQHLLAQFALMPNQAIKGKQFLEWIGAKEKKYRKTLKTLSQKGWLQSKDNLYYEMHRLVQMLILKELKPTYEESKTLVQTILDLTDEDKVNANPLAHQYLANYAKSLLAHLDFQEVQKTKGELENQLAGLYLDLGLYTQAEEYYLVSLETQKNSVGTKHQDYAEALNNLAVLYSTQGKYEKAESLYEEALKMRKEILGEKHPNYAQSLNNLAGLYDSQGKYEKAEPLYEKALKIRKEVLGEKHPEYASSLNNLAGLYYTQGKYAKAEPLYQETSKIFKEVLGEKHSNYATSLNNLAELYRTQGKYAKAKPLYEEALKIRKEVLGERHPDYATSLNNLAVLYRKQGKYKKAEPLYEETLKIRKEVLGEKHPDYASSLNNLASLYYAQSKYEKAEPLYQEALKIRKEVLGEKHPDYATSLNDLANLYNHQSKYAKAELLYQKVIKIYKEMLGKKHPWYATSLHNLGALYYQTQKYAKAKELLTEAYQIKLQVLGEEHPSTQNTKGYLKYL